MIKFFSMLFLIFILTSVEKSYAEYDWIPFNDSDKNITSYIDMNNIERVDDIIYYWLLLDYEEPQPLASKPNQNVLSAIAYRQFFCNSMGRRSIKSEFYSGKMASGDLLDEYDYPLDYPVNKLKPSEEGYSYWSNVCANTSKPLAPEKKIYISTDSSTDHTWEYTGADVSGTIIYYLDVANIKKSNKFIFTYTLSDFSSTTKEIWPLIDTIQSAVRYQQSDCDKMAFKTLETTTFSGSMGKGKTVYSTQNVGEWKYPELDKMAYGTIENLCSKYDEIQKKQLFNKGGQLS